MARDVLIRLIGTDEVSPVLRNVGDAAGDTAGKIEDLALSAEDTATDLAELEEKLSALATDVIRQSAEALLAIGGGVAFIGRSYRDHQIELDKMGRVFGESAEGINDLIGALGGSTLFGESDLVKGFNNLATLADDLDLTKIEDLGSVIADIAAVNNEDFATTAKAVAEALNGQGIALSNMGIVLEGDNPLERFNSLMNETAEYQGAAAEQAGDFYGWLTRMKNELAENARETGGWLGPLGQLGAFAADNALQLGIMGAALKQVVDAGISLHRLLGAAGLAGGLAGPVGLAAAALTAGLALSELFDILGSDAPIATEAAAENLESVYDLIVRLGEEGQLTGTALGITDLLEDVTTGFDALNALYERREELGILIYSLDKGAGAIGAEGIAEFASHLSEAEKMMLGWDEIASDGVVTMREWDDAMNGVENQLQDLSPAAEAVNAAMGDINEIMLASGEAGQEARARLFEYLTLLDSGEMSPEAFTANVADLTTALDVQSAALTKLNAAKSAFNVDNIRDAAAALGDIRLPGLGNVGAILEAEQAAIDAYAAIIEQRFAEIDAAVNGTADRLTTAFRVVVSNTNAIADQTQGVEEWVVALGQSRDVQEEIGIITYANQQIQEAVLGIQEQQAPLIAELTAEQAIFMDQLRDMPADQQLVALGFMDTALAAKAYELAMLPLSGIEDEMFVPMIENAAIADPILRSMLESIGLIATTVDENGELVITVNTDGAMNPIQELTDAITALNDTFITIFVGADTSAFQASVEDAVADARAMFQDVAGGGPDAMLGEPGIALALAVDDEELTEVLDGDYEVTVDVQLEFDRSGLAQMIGERIKGEGLLDITQDGIVIPVAADTGPAVTDFASLSELLDGLDDTIASPTVDPATDAAAAELDFLRDSLDLLNDYTATPEADLVDNASMGLRAIRGLLDGLYDRTITVTTQHVSVGTPGFGFQLADGGMVRRSEGGPIPALTAEHGHELVKFAEGGSAVMRGPAVRGLMPGDMVFSAPATRSMGVTESGGGGFTFINNGTVMGIDDFIEQVGRAIAPAMIKAMANNRLEHLS